MKHIVVDLEMNTIRRKDEAYILYLLRLIVIRD